MSPPPSSSSSSSSRARGRSVGRARLAKASPAGKMCAAGAAGGATAASPAASTPSSTSSVRFALPASANDPAPGAEKASTRLVDLPSCPLPAVAPRRAAAARKKQRNRSLSVSARRGRALFDKLGNKQRQRGWAPSRTRKEEEQMKMLLDQRTRSPSPPRGK